MDVASTGDALGEPPHERSRRGDVAVTEETRASLRGAAAERAEVLVHGIDVDRIAARPDGERAAVRAGLGLARDEFVIGTVANLRAQKDYPTLLGAARRARRSRSCLPSGRGRPGTTGTRDRGPSVTSSDCNDHVVLAGFRPDALAVMAACDVFVLASAWEGLPVAAMEAATLGLPIVATAVGGIAEQFGPADAMLVPPRDPVALAGALEAVVVDSCRRSELSTAARSAATRFDVHRAMATLTARYEQLAGCVCEPGPTAGRVAVGSRDEPNVRLATADDREQILSLLGVSLGWSDDPRYRELFAWKHERNPFGPSLAWVVERDGRVVAVRLFMRWMFRRGGSNLHAVRAVDTATHPDHQGRGLFTALTRHAVEACRAEGVAFVFNTPNDAEPTRLSQVGLARGRSSPRRSRGPEARATSSRSPAAACRRSCGQCRSTSAPTSRHGSTEAVAGPYRRPCRRPTGRCGPRQMRASPDGGTAWPTSHYRVVDDGRGGDRRASAPPRIRPRARRRRATRRSRPS